MSQSAPAHLQRRALMAALWTATSLTIAFVDLFSLYRPDVREQIDQGRIFVFEIGPAFLLGALIYVLVPIVMIPLSITLPRRVSRWVSIAVAGLMAITIVAGAIGEWGYYILGSAIELAMLAWVITLSATWRERRDAR